MKRILGIALLSFVALQCKTQVNINKKTGPKSSTKTVQAVELPSGTPAEQIQKVSQDYDQSPSCQNAPTTPSCVAANAIANTPVDTINNNLVSNTDLNVTVSIVGDQMNSSVTTVTDTTTETQISTLTQVTTQTLVTTATASSTTLSTQGKIGIALLVGGTVVAVAGGLGLHLWNASKKGRIVKSDDGGVVEYKTSSKKAVQAANDLKKLAQKSVNGITKNDVHGNMKKIILMGIIMGTVGAITLGTAPGMNLAETDSDLSLYISQLGAIGATFVH